MWSGVGVQEAGYDMWVSEGEVRLGCHFLCLWTRGREKSEVKSGVLHD